MLWRARKQELEELVATERLGKRGVRPFGSTAALQDPSRKTGKRLSNKDHRSVATTKRPNEGVMERLHR